MASTASIDYGRPAISGDTERAKSGAYGSVHVALQHRSLFLFAPHNRFRVAVARLVTSPRFEAFILLCIFVSSVALAVDKPHLAPDSKLKARRPIHEAINPQPPNCLLLSAPNPRPPWPRLAETHVRRCSRPW